jgi:hypothetical protein
MNSIAISTLAIDALPAIAITDAVRAKPDATHDNHARSIR